MAWFRPGTRAPAAHYAFYVHGPNEPQNGHRFDPAVALIDPYARRLSNSRALRSCVVDGDFDWGDDRPPAIPWRDTLIYELHVKGFTRLHPAVRADWRGKYLGLTVAPVIEHLKSIGVTAVELLPCQSFVSEQFLLDRRLSNYWGYNSVAWFSPASAICRERSRVRVQDHGEGAARRRYRGDSGRCVQSHRRRRRRRSAAVPERHRQFRLLPSDARRQAHLRECHRLRQHAQLRAPPGPDADHRLPQVLGRRNARRRIPIRSGDGAGARRQRLQRAQQFLQVVARRARCSRTSS